MYTPPQFAEQDQARIAAFIRANDFGLLVSRSPAGLAASHLPFLFDEPGGRLFAHVARANDQWRDIGAAGPVLVVFSGPHGYVSPRWYETQPAVPTWNYEAVHVTGRARAVHEPAALREIVDGLSRVYEAGVPRPWSIDGVP
ncbi:MAG TPA: FMN-binding negative transcriptional regulator, partial [Alphaproteobacteria bacterium]|nr:FMN-binding negative transcriptional regulator [Alphaproteobacteria bacterium]